MTPSGIEPATFRFVALQKHVECYSKINEFEKMVHVVGFTIDLPIKLHEIYYFTFINFGMFTFLFPSY